MASAGRPRKLNCFLGHSGVSAIPQQNLIPVRRPEPQRVSIGGGVSLDCRALSS
jgi:hypothetical protein